MLKTRLQSVEGNYQIDEPKRDYLLDNLRAILIILVVWGHMLTSYIFDYSGLKVIYYFLFFFHMPALTFISGYFSKNVDKCRENAVKDLLIPYLIWNGIEYVFKMVVLQESHFGFRFFRPLWGLWYLFALFVWRFLLKDIIRIRFVLPLSFIFAILSGFTKEFSIYMALGRIFCFLPFFLLGYYTKASHIEKIRKIPKLVSVCIVGLTAVLSAYLVIHNVFKVEVLYLRKQYPETSSVTFMGYRILVYIVALAMIFALINLVSKKRIFISQVGRNTLTVYILHLFTVPLYKKLELFQDKPYYALVASTIGTIIITYIYSRPCVINLYRRVFDMISGLVMKSNKVKEERS